MVSNTLVSIVIPAFNCARYLKEAIDSVLNQDYPDIELIVLDDGSTDETPAVLLEYGDRFFWERHANMGQSATLNKGWKMATGEFLGYLSADDSLLPNAISLSVNELKKNRNIVLSYCDYYLMDESSIITGRYFSPDYDHLKMLTHTLCPPGPGVLFRRQPFSRTGFWDTRLRQLPDYDYWLKLALLGPFLRIPEPLARFRVHSESQTCGLVDEEKSEEIMDVLSRFFCRDDLSADLLSVRNRSVSSGHIFSASLHLRSRRYEMAFDHISKALKIMPTCLFSRLAWQRLVYGFFFQSRKNRSVQ